MSKPTMSVYTLFLTSFNRHPEDKTLKNLPMDSVCGRDCTAIIYAAKSLLKLCDPVSHQEILRGVETAISVCWNG